MKHIDEIVDLCRRQIRLLLLQGCAEFAAAVGRCCRFQGSFRIKTTSDVEVPCEIMSLLSRDQSRTLFSVLGDAAHRMSCS